MKPRIGMRQLTSSLLLGELMFIAVSLGMLVGLGFGVIVQLTGPTLIEQIVLAAALIVSAVAGAIAGLHKGSMRARK